MAGASVPGFAQRGQRDRSGMCDALPMLGWGRILLLVAIVPALSGCELLAYGLVQSTKLPATRRSECAAAEQACAERGLEEACSTIAECHRTGRGRPRDEALAIQYEQLACDDGSARRCAELARRLAQGSGAPRDPARALLLLQRACYLGGSDECCELGRVYEAGDRRFGLAQGADAPRALAAYRRACWHDAHGPGRGCDLAEQLAKKPSAP